MLITNVCRLMFMASVPLYIIVLYLNKPVEGRRLSAVRDTDQFRMLEQSLLRSLGLNSRPRPRRGVKVPQHMKDLYHSHQEHPDWISTNFRFNGKWTAANTIRSFFHEDEQTKRISRNESSIVLTFDLSSMPGHENVTTAQLRLHRRQGQKKTDSPSSLSINVYRVNIYQVLKPATATRPASLRLLDSRRVDVEKSGWETFDVLSAVRHWTARPEESFGIQIHTLREDGQHTNHSALVFLKEQADRTLNDDEWNDLRPLLVAYNHDGKEYKKRRQKRRAPAISPTPARPKKNFCRRHPLYVNFVDVNWDEWIVAPSGYDAYFCQGVCPFPIDAHLNTTNHAVVQTLVHNVNPRAVPGVCCVPTTLKPISMLYLNVDEKAVLRNYPSMVVEGCGCR